MKTHEQPINVEDSARATWRIESPDELQQLGTSATSGGCTFYGTLYPEGTVLRKGDVVAYCSGGQWVGAPAREVLV